jgi:hypothetical protein
MLAVGVRVASARAAKAWAARARRAHTGERNPLAAKAGADWWRWPISNNSGPRRRSAIERGVGAGRESGVLLLRVSSPSQPAIYTCEGVGGEVREGWQQRGPACLLTPSTPGGGRHWSEGWFCVLVPLTVLPHPRGERGQVAWLVRLAPLSVGARGNEILTPRGIAANVTSYSSERRGIAANDTRYSSERRGIAANDH